MRFYDEEGHPLVGRRIAESEVQEVKAAFGIGVSWDTASAWHEVGRGGSARLGDLVFYQTSIGRRPASVFRAIVAEETEQFETTLLQAGCRPHEDPWGRTIFIVGSVDVLKEVAAERPFVPLQIPVDELAA